MNAFTTRTDVQIIAADTKMAEKMGRNIRRWQRRPRGQTHLIGSKPKHSSIPHDGDMASIKKGMGAHHEMCQSKPWTSV